MTAPDAIAEFKAKQRESWAHFAPLEFATTTTAGRLVRFAGVRPGQHVLDVGCGTGVVAITARRGGARVTGLDLTPELLARAKENASVPGFEDITWREGDAEALPFRDGEFDVVLSQFGHMFAPRPDVATTEMLRVLKPGGTIAFSTWPPELGIGRMFALLGGYLPPPPPGVAPPSQWGDVAVIRQRLDGATRDLAFDRGAMRFPALSPAHWRLGVERTSGPIIKLVEALRSEPAKLERFRQELEAVGAAYFEPDANVIRQDFLMTRAVKA